MAIFGDLKVENKVQVNDKTRLSGVESFISKDEAAISLVRIKAEDSESFVDVTGSNSDDWYLDWAYATAGSKTVTLEITTNAAAQTFTATIDVVTEADDKLFSNDSDLVEIEDDILKYIRKGRNSWKDKHRQAQKRIMDSLDRRKLFDADGSKLTKEQILGTEEIKQWSTYLTLSIIYEGLIVEPEDVFTGKATHYRGLAGQAENSAIIRLDTNEDGDQDVTTINLQTGSLKRR